MTAHALRSWWAEPRPGDVPGLGPRDWAMVAVLIGWSVVEAVVRQDLAPARCWLSRRSRSSSPNCGDAAGR